MEVLESYATHLEEKVAERSGELDAANKALEGLLHEVGIGLVPCSCTCIFMSVPLEGYTPVHVQSFFADASSLSSDKSRKGTGR